MPPEVPPPDEDPSAVRRMFDRIAPSYDRLNRVMTLALDERWRRRSVELLAPSPGDLVVDVGTGTGDLAVHLAAAGARVVGVDPAGGMLAEAQAKVRKGGEGEEVRRDVALVRGDALGLPLPDASVDGVASAFVLRNLPDRGAFLAEARRVLRPGGAFVSMEMFEPRGHPLAPLLRFHVRRVLPRVGSAFGGDRDAYRYLGESITRIGPSTSWTARLEAAGFEDVEARGLLDGLVVSHRARRF